MALGGHLTLLSDGRVHPASAQGQEDLQGPAPPSHGRGWGDRPAAHHTLTLSSDWV